MKTLFDELSVQISKMTTRKYSTSFSLGIFFLNSRLHDPIYSIYGFVRIADEIVDSFEGYNKKQLLAKFKQQTYQSIETKISSNPILNSFQKTVQQYHIDHKLIELFFNSMEMDLKTSTHSQQTYQEYILGSAEVVGLMCLYVFIDGDRKLYNQLKPYAMKLGSAFQKVNFLRDLQEDYYVLGRTYFPDVDIKTFSESSKQKIENDIENDFKIALEGIKKLPPSSKGGVYLAYATYYSLFKKIKQVPAQQILSERVRINNGRKLGLMLNSFVQNKLNWI